MRLFDGLEVSAQDSGAFGDPPGGIPDANASLNTILPSPRSIGKIQASSLSPGRADTREARASW
jgi:hypothetical protein